MQAWMDISQNLLFQKILLLLFESLILLFTNTMTRLPPQLPRHRSPLYKLIFHTFYIITILHNYIRIYLFATFN